MSINMSIMTSDHQMSYICNNNKFYDICMTYVHQMSINMSIMTSDQQMSYICNKNKFYDICSSDVNKYNIDITYLREIGNNIFFII